MNRPSLYGAFGDKRDIYLKAIERYRQASRTAIEAALARGQPLCDALGRVYAAALSLYVSGKQARGCFLIGTAATEAVDSPEVRAALAASLRELDEAFEARIRHARDEGELPPDADPAALARLASAVLHTLAIRARAGEKRAALEATAAAGIDLICGSHRVRERRSGSRRKSPR